MCKQHLCMTYSHASRQSMTRHADICFRAIQPLISITISRANQHMNAAAVFSHNSLIAYLHGCWYLLWHCGCQAPHAPSLMPPHVPPSPAPAAALLHQHGGGGAPPVNVGTSHNRLQTLLLSTIRESMRALTEAQDTA